MKGISAALFALLMTLALPAFADEVAWLKEVRTPPDNVPAPPRRLAPLLVTAEGQPIRTREEWERARQRLRDKWLNFLGPMPTERPPLELEVLKEERVEGCLRQLVRYQCEPGRRVEAYLLRPTTDSGQRTTDKRPGLVILHPTTPDTIDVVAGVKGDESRQLGLKLARRGFVVCCPRCFLWQDVTDYKEAVRRFQERHPQTLGMHKMLYDAMRGVDVLLSLPEVDPQRIGAAGHSLGAKETLYLMAFDERVKAGVASEGGIGLDFSNWDAPWYLGEGIKAKDFPLEHHQLLALIAPRPFLIFGGERGPGAVDGDRGWPYIAAALPVYELYGQPARIGLYNHRQGHSVPPMAFERLAEWLETALGSEDR